MTQKFEKHSKASCDILHVTNDTTNDVKAVVTVVQCCAFNRCFERFKAAAFHGTSEKNSFGGQLPQVGPMRPPPQVSGDPPGQANSEQRYLRIRT